MKVLIIGANGKIGRLLAEKMARSENFEPTAFIRNESQKEYFISIGVSYKIASLESSEQEIAEAIKGFDAVVFTAGSGGATGYDKTIEIDLYGAIKSINAAKLMGIKHFVMVSAAFADEPTFWSESNIKPYYIAKHLADMELKRSGVNYTIIRPVRLTDAADSGKIRVELNPKDLNKEIPRVAAADVILEVLNNDSAKNKTLEISEGTSNINDAVLRFVK
ncbi:SDR family oxidoreductase [Plebeiibacterium sediminum]|uniref:SDR family oxidoreductase n=1 Tax=Plebeiibacterium sediminum TaxID=2992112 RepID=A0AAE3M5P2_9BACT|nr:SDR family oxidoreductase [Plebeiobacterium sediminum]MCW3787295.1 SDR family oxidoreductase [Plebeiobacterium sediminum]